MFEELERPELPESDETVMANTAPQSGYASVNGLEMYHEIHGSGRPLVLLHGGLSAIGTSFGALLSSLAKTRQVIAVEQQAHGRTADIDRPLSIGQMAKDTAELLRQIGIGKTDILGYSVGAGVALQMALDHPELIRKLVLISIATSPAGLHPGILEGIESMTPEAMVGTPFHEEYVSIAPRPDDWPKLIEKMQAMDRDTMEWPDEAIRSVKAPTLIVIGDSDIVRPEHAVEIFRLVGGGVAGDLTGLPSSQLAVLPGTTHITVVHRTDLLLQIIPAFLDAAIPGE